VERAGVSASLIHVSQVWQVEPGDAHASSPHRALAAAVIRCAVEDLMARAPLKRSRRRAWDVNHASAVAFLFGSPTDSTFEWMAHGLGLDPADLRSRLRKKVSK
jgi:hypothetical protein